MNEERVVVLTQNGEFEWADPDAIPAGALPMAEANGAPTPRDAINHDPASAFIALAKHMGLIRGKQPLSNTEVQKELW